MGIIPTGLQVPENPCISGTFYQNHPLDAKSDTKLIPLCIVARDKVFCLKSHVSI